MSSLWQEAAAEDGKTYYYNTQTKITQWTKPVELMTSAERALQDLPWKQHKAANGNPYWYHEKTRETTWTMPAQYKEALDRANESIAAPQAPAFVAGGVQHQNHERQVAIPGHMMEAGHDGTARPMSHPSARDFVGGDKNEPQYHSFDEAESAFIKLLRRHNIAADWPWEKTMRVIIKEPQYRALKDPKDRKAAFEKYIMELKQQEQEKAKDRIAKLRQDFSVMLKSHPEIKYYSRWKTARAIIEGETIFRSTSDEDERRQLFKEYVAELWKKHQEDEAKKRREGVNDLVALLQSLALEPYTRWSDAQTIIQQNERFQSEAKFQALSKLDVLNAFESHIKVLEREFNDKRQRIKTAKARKERKNREAFLALLNELRVKGEIRAGSKWKTVYPLFKDDERYQNMLGQPGSTPLDLFWDTVEEMERDLRLRRGIVEDVMAERRFNIQEGTSFSEFADLLKNDSRTAQYDEDTLTILFERLREKLVRRQDEDRHQVERQNRRRIDAFRSYMRHLEPAIEVTETWEKAKIRMQDSEEYKAVDTDANRRAAFDRHIRRLKEKADDREKEKERSDRDRDRKSERDRGTDRERERERDRGDRTDRERERNRPSSRTRRRDDRDREESRPGYDSYTHKSRSARPERDASRTSRPRSRTPESNTYETERRRAADERERQYRRRDSSVQARSERGSRRDSRSRVRDDSRARGDSRDRSRLRRDREREDRTESIYDRERREREEERERQYSMTMRDRDEYRPARRRRGLTPEDEDRDAKRTRRERTPRLRTTPPPLSRERIFEDVPSINYGDDPMINYGDDPYNGRTEPPTPSTAAPPTAVPQFGAVDIAAMMAAPKPAQAPVAKKVEKKVAAHGEKKEDDQKPAISAINGGDKMDVDKKDKADESEEGEVAE